MIKPRVVGPGARDRTSRASKRNGKVTRWARFPMTLFLAMEYGLLVIYPAWQHRRPFPSFVFVVPLVVIAIAAYVEWLAKRLSVRRSTKPFPTSRFGFGIGLVGVLATLIQSLLGAGTYAVQVGSDSVSPLANIFTPFASLAQIGAALVIYGWYRGTCTRGRALARLGSLVVMQFAIAVLLIGTTAPAYEFALAVAFGGVVTKLVSTRQLAIGVVVVLLAWPIVVGFRNQTRSSVTDDPQNFIGASARLQDDSLLAAAEHLAISRSAFLTLPGILRYGLVPRFIDVGRPNLDLVHVLSVAMGSTWDNSIGVTTVGSFYLYGGWPATIGYALSVTWILSLLLHRDNAWAFVVSVLIAFQLLWIEGTFPVDVTGLLQSLVSAGGVYLGFRVWSAYRTKRWLARTSSGPAD
jgi:hypothetical protein